MWYTGYMKYRIIKERQWLEGWRIGDIVDMDEEAARECLIRNEIEEYKPDTIITTPEKTTKECILCHKEFTNGKGLNMHTIRVHKQGNE